MTQQRIGLIAKKVGMSRVFTPEGDSIPVSILKIESCQVTDVRTVEKNGYSAVQLGVGVRKSKNISKAVRNTYAKNKIEPKAKVAEFRVPESNVVPVGSEILASHFVVGQYVDVSGSTVGRGFAGPMKRHNFAGLRATHGVSVSHRSHGSTGQRQDPGRVFKNKRMAGHMGDVQMTQQNLQVVSVDDAQGLLIVKGSVPGSENGYLIVKDAVKRALPKNAPMPAAVKAAAA